MLSHKLLSQIVQVHGFSAMGCAPAEAVEEWRVAQWKDYLRSGRHAEMHYLEQHLEKRLNPQLLVEGAQSVVCVALNYFTEEAFSGDTYSLARYARGKDYHDVVKEGLQKILHSIAELTGNAAPGRAFCDTAPVDEHYWAWRTGLGWLGRNTQLIIPQAGSYYFIGTLILTEPIDHYDSPQPNRCGTCTRCLEVCPTRALTEKGIDARRCLSYLTIEHRGALPDFAQKALRNDATTPLCLYGCDRCQDVCPHNRFAMPTSCEAFRPSPALLQQTAEDWRHLTVETYRTLFKGSAVKRAKYEGLQRNIAALNENNEGDALT